MSTPLRSFLAIIAGLLAAFFHVGAIESLGHILYPIPAGLDFSNYEAMAAYVRGIPTGALGIILVAWAFGSFAGSWVAARLAPEPRRPHGLAIGALMTLATLGNLASLPHPAWVWVTGLGSVFPAGYLGARLACRPISPATAPDFGISEAHP